MLIRQFAGFAFVGVVATAIDYLLFCGFLYFLFEPLFANFLAFSIASLVGLHFNTKKVFSRNYSVGLVVRYYVVQGAGLASTSLILYFLDGLSSPEVLKLIAIMIVPFQTFLLNKFLVFK